MENNHSFEYTYSAAQQQEVVHIRKKYLPKEEDKMEQLRTLHYSATKKAKAASIAIGVIGALILGTGMSLIMTELGAVLGELVMVFGVPVGLTGLVLVALAYPVYNRVLKKERERIAPEILRLSEELLNNRTRGLPLADLWFLIFRKHKANNLKMSEIYNTPIQTTA